MTIREYKDLKLEITRKERELFDLKKKLSKLKLPPISKVVITYNPYNCNSCYNTSCLNYQLKGKESVIIKNQTTMCGCMDWLPKGKKNE